MSQSLILPDPIYILDICINGNEINLVEINPFSGADLYGCDRNDIVAAVEKLLTSTKGQQQNPPDLYSAALHKGR